MKILDDTLFEFKDGNEQKRLDLYLNKRNLRSELDQIENEECESINTKILTDTKQIVNKKSNAIQQQSLLVRMRRWCFSLLS